MPRFAFHALPLATVQAASVPMADDLQALLGCPREELVFTVPTAHVVLDEAIVNGPPFVEVAWFDRGIDTQDAVARILTDRLREAGCPSVDICFLPLARRSYYEDGKPF